MTARLPQLLPAGDARTRALAAGTAAVIVTYRPALDLGPTLSALRALIGQVLLVDNSEQAPPGLAEQAARAGATLLLNGNRGGLAGAYNLALQQLQRQPDVQHVVFLDQDSDPSSLGLLLADPDNQRLLLDDKTAALSAAYRDRATGLRGKYMRLQRLGLSYLPREFAGPQAVAFVINSMSVWRRAALDRLGPFHEGLRIDHVDTEYCLRARRAGLQVWVNGSHEFAHAIGERRRFRFLGREMQAGGHGPRRRYLIGRNTAWLARTQLLHEPAFAALCLMRLAYEVVGIVKAEPQAGPKLRALLRGALAGLLLPLPREVPKPGPAGAR